MTSRYEAYMDNTSLSSVDSSILVLDIGYPETQFDNSLLNFANRDGGYIKARHKQSAQCQITFEIHKYSIADRQEVCQKVVKWANGSVLKTNDRPNQQLRCVCDQYPSINSAKKWTDPVTMVFTGHEFPYWEDTEQTTLTLTGTEASGTMSVPGVLGNAFVEATITPLAAMSSITLTVGYTSITLEGLSADTTDTITISYDSRKIQSIKMNDTSILDKRTGASSDDLLAKCGTTVTFAIESETSSTVVFKARGCYS